VDPEITPIRVGTENTQDREMETAARHLFQVVKDHNNDSTHEMLNISYVYCYHHADESTDEEDSQEEEITLTHFPLLLCALVIVNQ
jgi:hypothetical protein